MFSLALLGYLNALEILMSPSHILSLIVASGHITLASAERIMLRLNRDKDRIFKGLD